MGGHQVLPESVASETMAQVIWPQKLARDDNVDAKESGRLSNVIRRGYVRVVEVKSLNH